MNVNVFGFFDIFFSELASEDQSEMLRLLAALLILSSASSFSVTAPRPILTTSTAAPARSGAIVNLLPPPSVSATNLIAALPGLGPGYGGNSAFWDNASGSAGGDLTTIFFLAILFPTAVTVFFFTGDKGE